MMMIFNAQSSLSFLFHLLHYLAPASSQAQPVGPVSFPHCEFRQHFQRTREDSPESVSLPFGRPPKRSSANERAELIRKRDAVAPPSLLPKSRRCPNEVCGIITGSQPSDPGLDVVYDDGNHDSGPKALTRRWSIRSAARPRRNSRSRAVFSTMPIRPSPHAPHLRIPPCAQHSERRVPVLSFFPR